MKKIISRTLLSLCILTGGPICGQLQVNAGCMVSVEPYEGTLIQAAQEGNLNGIKYLLSHSKNPIEDLNVTSDDGDTALIIAAKNNNEDIIKYVVSHYYKFNDCRVNFFAGTINTSDKIDFLYGIGDINDKNRHLRDLIVTAASKGYYSILKYMVLNEYKYYKDGLFSGGGDVPKKEIESLEMLEYLMRNNFGDAVVYLLNDGVLKFGLNLNEGSYYGGYNPDIGIFSCRNNRLLSEFFQNYIEHQGDNHYFEGIIRYLKEECGWDIERILESSLSEIHARGSRDSRWLVNILLEKFDLDYGYLLCSAVYTLNIDLIVFALENGADPYQCVEYKGSMRSALDVLECDRKNVVERYGRRLREDGIKGEELLRLLKGRSEPYEKIARAIRRYAENKDCTEFKELLEENGYSLKNIM